jgi:hypothetical protein
MMILQQLLLLLMWQQVTWQLLLADESNMSNMSSGLDEAVMD